MSYATDFDGNLAALDRHLRDLDRAELRDEAIEQRATELFAGEYRPDTFAAISEALGETAGDLADAIDAVASSGDLAAIGATVMAASTLYWQQLATQKAKDEIDRACPKCFGHGCRNCEDPDTETD